MASEEAIKSNIEILTSLTGLTAAIDGKEMDTYGMTLDAVTAQCVTIHFLHLLEEVTALAKAHGWVLALRTVRARAINGDDEDADQQTACDMFLKETAPYTR